MKFGTVGGATFVVISGDPLALTKRLLKAVK